MIIPVYQPLGGSTHRLAQQVGALYHTKATHTGTLDPMAEGVVVVLTDQDRFQKEQHSDWHKQYQFQILVGISTDSHDLLGLVQESNQINPQTTIDALKQILDDLIGPQQQVTPDFSAKRYQGQSFFDHAKQGIQLPPISQQIEIYDLQLMASEVIPSQQLQENIEQKIAKVKGNFRQSEIVQGWQAHFSKQKWINYQIITCHATTSKRTYIRGLVRDLSQKTGIPLTTYHILRTQNGPYSVADCICLV